MQIIEDAKEESGVELASRRTDGKTEDKCKNRHIRAYSMQPHKKQKVYHSGFKKEKILSAKASSVTVVSHQVTRAETM